MKAQLEKILKDQLLKEKEDYNNFLALRAILVKYEGKAITKRIEKELPIGFSLKIVDRGIEIINENKKDVYNTHYVCYNNQKNDFKISYFENCDSPHNAGALDRINKLEAILNDKVIFSKMVLLYKKLHKASYELKNIVNEINKKGNYTDSFYNPSYYEICRFLNIDSKLLNFVYYGK